ncbi:MAG: hypothetical protein NT062_31690 [Proteobacteria bacterium]|nr:hypothetical protein [Pseudomonadota bacterium]
MVRLASLARGQRFALSLLLGFGYAAYHTQVAYADDDDDGGEEGGGDGDGAEGGGGGDGDGEGEGEGEDDKDQPPVTAGGLYNIKTYPVREISRPLTMTQKLAQVRVALGTDISAKGAFGSFGLSVEGIYGYADNFALIGGVTNAYNGKAFGVYFGFEGALAYDFVNIRLAANVHRNAIANFENFCTPVSSADTPTMCATPGAESVSLPNGKYDAGNTKFSLDLGFPFRYAIKPEIAIVALQTLMSIDFNSIARDHTIQSQMQVDDGMGGMRAVFTNVPVGNTAKPDLKPSLGIATNPIPPLSVTIFAQLLIPDFDTSAGAFQVPVTGRVEFSPSQKLDVGLEFTLLNVKPPEGQSAIDNRFLSLFMQGRFGK